MDWTNQSHLLQAILVGVCVIVFWMGYRSGDRL